MVSVTTSDVKVQSDSESLVTIRAATSTDAVAIHRVMQSAFSPLISRGYPKKAIDRTISKPWRIRDRILSDSLVFVAETDGEIVGTATGIEEHESMRISSLGVHPKYQCRGIGTELLKTLESVAVKNGNHKLFLATAWAMTEAIQLYRSLGYKKEGYLRSHYYGEDLIFFSKYLSKEDDEYWSSSDLKHKTLHYSWRFWLF